MVQSFLDFLQGEESKTEDKENVKRKEVLLTFHDIGMNRKLLHFDEVYARVLISSLAASLSLRVHVVLTCDLVSSFPMLLALLLPFKLQIIHS